jgi:hypothetical protein
MRKLISAEEKAKRAVESWCSDGPGRKWLEASTNSYGQKDRGWRADFFALEGSPARGFVIVTASYAIAISRDGSKKRVYERDFRVDD